MAILRSQIEQSDLTKYIPPKGDYETFRDDDYYREKLKEWGLPAAKREFWYKEDNYQRLVTIKGYETYGNTGEFNTLVIEFQDGNLTCIHPAYLKEMQQSSFGKESMLTFDEKETAAPELVTADDEGSSGEEAINETVSIEDNPAKADKAAAPKPAKAKEP